MTSPSGLLVQNRSPDAWQESPQRRLHRKSQKRVFAHLRNSRSRPKLCCVIGCPVEERPWECSCTLCDCRRDVRRLADCGSPGLEQHIHSNRRSDSKQLTPRMVSSGTAYLAHIPNSAWLCRLGVWCRRSGSCSSRHSYLGSSKFSLSFRISSFSYFKPSISSRSNFTSWSWSCSSGQKIL